MEKKPMKRGIFSRHLLPLALAALAAAPGCGTGLEGVELSEGARPMLNGAVMSAEGSGHVRFSNCSGALISDRWVLSAARCFSDHSVANPGTRWVRMGSQVTVAQSIIRHPVLNVALVKLADAMVLGKSTAGHLPPLHRGDATGLIGRHVQCFGYGKNTFAGGISDVLRTATLRVADEWTTKLRLVPGAAGQAARPGDYGGACVINSVNGAPPRGIPSNRMIQWPFRSTRGLVGYHFWAGASFAPGPRSMGSLAIGPILTRLARQAS